MSLRSLSNKMPVVLGAFELVEPLARGGAGEVWRGRHTVQEVDVAVKLLDASSGEGRRLRAFEREVGHIARLDHPGIVRLYDFGQIDAATEQLTRGALVAGTPYLVMELASRSLRQISLPLRWGQLRTLLLSVLDALSHAHARTVIHRDLKPANVLFDVRTTADGDESLTVKLTDFGIAQAAFRTVTESSSQGFSGTPAYIAPEQLLGTRRDIGPWTDLYSLGVMAYELASGKLPFRADTLIGLIQAHVTSRPARFEAAGYPPGFADWLHRLMAKAPGDRFQHAADAAWALFQLPAEDPADVGFADADPKLLIELVSEAFDIVSDAAVASDGMMTHQDTLRQTQVHEGLQVTFQSATVSTLSFAVDDERPAPLPVGRDHPPVPRDWRQARVTAAPVLAGDAATGSAALLGAGLGLLDSRIPPMVGRDRERDVLWRALVDVHDTGRAHAVIVRGARGIGKTRLVQWLTTRSYELGAAFTMLATMQAMMRPEGGMIGGAGRLLQLRGETPEEARKRLRAFIETGCTVVESSRPRQAAGQAPASPQVEADVEAILELIEPVLARPETPRTRSLTGLRAVKRKPADEAPGARSRTLARRRHAMSTLLREFCRQRPVVLWFDDVHFDAESLQLTRDLIAERPELGRFPLLLLCTVDDAELAERPAHGALIDEIAASDRTRSLTLEPLAEPDQVQILHAFLGIEEALAHDIQRRTGQNPAAAIALVRDWSRRELLEPGPRGFRLRDLLGDDEVLARDISRTWDRRRLGLPVVDPAPPRADDPSERALEIAAALGEHFRLRDWQAVCAACQLTVDASHLEALAGRDLVARVQDAGDGEQWRFAAARFHEAFAERARQHGRWHLHHRACARTLARLEQGIMGGAERLAWHWREAGEFEQAIESLLDAALDRLSRGDREGAHGLLVHRETLMTQQAVATDDARWARGWLVRARVRLRDGDVDAAHADIDRAVALADAIGNVDVRAEACWTRGYLALATAARDDGLAAFGEALTLFREIRNGVGVARTWAALGELRRSHGELQAACEAHRQAANLYRALGDRAGIGRSLTALAQDMRLLGNDEAAESLVLDALPFLRAVRDDVAVAHNLNLCGELSRSRGALQEAIRYHGEALRMLTEIASPDAVVAELSLGSALLEQRDFDRARHHLLSACAGCERLGRTDDLGVVHIGLLACAARDQSWADYDTHLALARHWLQRAPLVDDEIARPARLAGELALEARHWQRARGALEIACEQYRALGRSRELLDVMHLLDRASAP